MPKWPTDDYTSPTTTEFPKSWSKDIRTQARMAEERWRRSYPLISYYCIKKAITPRDNLSDFDELVGETGTTKFDPLWREAVPANVTDEWEQPNTTDDLDATARYQHEDAIHLHATVRREGTNYDLQRYGFDKVRDLLLFVPILFFDRFNRKPQPGDIFEWDGDRFYVLETKRSGYWKNSNIRIFYTINSERLRRGS